uniref:PPIase cyclophilin-type domain-containing protein n=1 Tax=Cyclophora tenuis TaxID=216820 RepID=A0A7S1D247_CYCTE
MEHGKGPFVVEFKLKFPTTMGPAVEPNTFGVELASLSEMPHTIFTFLDLVDLQLFDGTAFVAANAMQMEGGSPGHAATDRAIKLYERYAKFGYSRSPLAFNEYSPRFPHEQFTVGFVGSPVAGPGLVINMVNNSETRGLNEHGRPTSPCFGKVIQGFDTLARMQSAPKSADGYRLAKNIEIESVRIVRNRAQAPQQQQQQQHDHSCRFVVLGIVKTITSCQTTQPVIIILLLLLLSSFQNYQNRVWFGPPILRCPKQTRLVRTILNLIWGMMMIYDWSILFYIVCSEENSVSLTIDWTEQKDCILLVQIGNCFFFVVVCVVGGP